MEKEFKISEACLDKYKRNFMISVLAVTYCLFTVIYRHSTSARSFMFLLGGCAVVLVVFVVIPFHFSFKKMTETSLVIMPGQLIQKTGKDEERIPFDEIEKINVVYGDSEEKDCVKLFSKNRTIYLQNYEDTEEILDGVSRYIAEDKINISEGRPLWAKLNWKVLFFLGAVIVIGLLFFRLLDIYGLSDYRLLATTALVLFPLGIVYLLCSFEPPPLLESKFQWVKSKKENKFYFIGGIILVVTGLLFLGSIFLSNYFPRYYASISGFITAETEEEEIEEGVSPFVCTSPEDTDCYEKINDDVVYRDGTGNLWTATITFEGEKSNWGCAGQSIAGARSVTDGQSNTTAIVEYHNDSDNFKGNNYYTYAGDYADIGCHIRNDGTAAARLCDDLDYAGEDNWYLPAIKELREDFGNSACRCVGWYERVEIPEEPGLHRAIAGGQNRCDLSEHCGGWDPDAGYTYWSSTESEHNPPTPWSVFFRSGTTSNSSEKFVSSYVRCRLGD